ncbi:MAG TPA: hypothetical protein VE871_02445 [Longimicrobium sp.]|nr:hypothetical protein [Longimicrobium sp.]
MFRITRGISLDYSPAFPNPSFRFPNATALRIYGGDEVPDAAPSPAPSEASIDADQPKPGAPGASPSPAPT